MRGYNVEAFSLLQTKIRGGFSSFNETKFYTICKSGLQYYFYFAKVY